MSGEVRVRLDDPATYQRWRYTEAVKLYDKFFKDSIRLDDKDVLDLGCGYGALSYLLAARGSKSVVGVDVDPGSISRAEECAKHYPSPVVQRVEFRLGSEQTIPLASASTDIVFLFNVMPALSRPAEILSQCWRVLRKKGCVCISFSPWLHPYGFGMENLIPIPWGHVLFSAKTLITTAAKIYDSKYYTGGHWDYDPTSGARKPNRWQALIDSDNWSNVRDVVFNNPLTIWKFLKLVKNSRFTVKTLQLVGFSGKFAKLSRPLVHLPVAREYVTSLVVCTLKKEG